MTTAQAFFDLGSNSTRFLQVSSAAGDTSGFSPALVENRGARVTRLGAGLTEGGRLDKEAIKRVLEAMRAYDETVRSHGGEWAAGIATSACRRGRNSDELFEQVREVTGVTPDLISGTREGKLTARGVRASLGQPDKFRILDIGGGSTEWIVSDTGDVTVESFNFGVVTLLESCVRNGCWKPGFDDCVKEILDRDFTIDLKGDGPLVLVGGTGTTLAACDLELEEYSHEQVHGYYLDGAKLDKLEREITGIPFENLSDRPMIPAGRADVLMPGLKIVGYARRFVGEPETLVSDYGILAGLADRILRTD